MPEQFSELSALSTYYFPFNRYIFRYEKETKKLDYSDLKASDGCCKFEKKTDNRCRQRHLWRGKGNVAISVPKNINKKNAKLLRNLAWFSAHFPLKTVFLKTEIMVAVYSSRKNKSTQQLKFHAEICSVSLL